MRYEINNAYRAYHISNNIFILETWRSFAAHPSWSLAGVFMLENLLYLFVY